MSTVIFYFTIPFTNLFGISQIRIQCLYVRKLLEWICKSFRKHNYWKHPPHTNLIISPAHAKKNKRRAIVHSVRSTDWDYAKRYIRNTRIVMKFSTLVRIVYSVLHRPHVNKSSPCVYQSRSSPWTVIPPFQPPAPEYESPMPRSVNHNYRSTCFLYLSHVENISKVFRNAITQRHVIHQTRLTPTQVNIWFCMQTHQKPPVSSYRNQSKDLFGY